VPEGSLPGLDLILARALVYAALLPAAGLPLYMLSAGREIAQLRALRVSFALLAAIAAAGSVWWVLASVAAMAAVPLGSLDRETVGAILAATPLGTVIGVRLAALLAFIVAALAPMGRFRLPLLALCGSAALATCALAGHAGATESVPGLFHRSADVIHLLAAAMWLGGLAMLLAGALRRNSEPNAFARELTRFARSGTLIVAALVLTGVVNSLAILGWPLPPALWSSLWGAVLAAKLALFGVMLAIAALNRWRLTPALAAGRAGANKQLRRSLMLETGLMLAVLALVSALGLLDPAG
jgi:copper resistance protein D